MDDGVNALRCASHEIEISKISHDRFLQVGHLDDITAADAVALTFKACGDKSTNLASGTGY
jgi:poly(3-hydroxyalkanoate) synthetase